MLPDFTLRHFHRLISNTTRRRLLVACLLQFFILAFLASVTAETIFVDDDGTTGALGNDWSQAKQSISEALENAVPGDQIWVAEGNYLESIDLMTGFQLYGGFAGTETDPSERDLITHTTTIDGSTARAGSPAFHVVRMEGLKNTRLDGFTIQGGVADGEGDDSQGGGVFCVNLNETNTIINCVIQNNSADQGGGMFCQDSDLFLTSCTFTLNSVNGADGEGYTGEGVEAIGNPGQDGGQGGGLFLTGGAPTLRHCVFEANSADGGKGAQEERINYYLPGEWDGGDGGNGGTGGGLCAHESQATLITCQFWGNTASGDAGGSSGDERSGGKAGIGGSGGGLYSNTGNLTLISCDFMRNVVNGGGGGSGGDGIFGGWGERGGEGGNGGGMFADMGNVILNRCMFEENSATGGRGGAEGNRFVGDGLSGGTGGSGGGLCNKDSSVILNQCEFHANSVNGGLGAKGWDLDDYTYYNANDGSPGSGGLGGGICNNNSQTILERCVFLSNTSSGGRRYTYETIRSVGAFGGGLYNSHSTASLSQCFFDSNTTDGNGGGLCDSFGTTTLTNCLFNKNISIGFGYKGGKGGGAAFLDSRSVNTNSCVFFSNTTKSYIDNEYSYLKDDGKGGGLYGDSAELVEISNTIFHQNGADGIFGIEPGSVSYCLFNNETNDKTYLAGPSNIGGDPKFANEENADFHLRNGSSALDRGDPMTAAPFDFEGDPRPGDDGLIDIGIDEAPGDFLPPPDTDAPESWINGPLALLTTTVLIDIPFISLDATSGVQFIELYYQKADEEWKKYKGAFTESPIVFDTSTTGGDGLYEFRTLARDNSNNIETIHSLPDVKTFVITSFTGPRIYVNQNVSGKSTGKNWANALTELTPALKIAEHYGITEIWVAKGHYRDSIVMQNNMSLYGGFQGIETELYERDGEFLNPTDTIINAQEKGRVSTFSNISNAILDGFFLTSGTATRGGGVYCNNVDETISIRNCLIRENFASGGSPSAGGGIYCNNSSPLFKNCTISQNSSRGRHGSQSSDFYNSTAEDGPPGDALGGGVYLNNAAPTFEQCRITRNRANGGSGAWVDYGDGSGYSLGDAKSHGGGLYAQGSYPILLDCRIESNDLYGGYPWGGQGGGLFLEKSQALIMNTIIRDNIASAGSKEWGEGANASGGGLSVSSYSTLTLENCAISKNRARGGDGNSEEFGNYTFAGGDGYGGGIFGSQSHIEIANCTFYNNKAQYGTGGYDYPNNGSAIGGALFLGNSSVNIVNTILQENSASAIHGEVESLRNCLFYNNLDGDYYDFTEKRSVFGAESINSLPLQASGNIDGDPKLVFPQNGDFRIASGSAAIDAGSAHGAPDIDIAYNPRPFDIPGYGTEGSESEFDIGAFEATLPLPGVKKFLNDLNGDGRSDLILKEKSTGRVDLALVNDDADGWTTSYSSVWGERYDLLGTGDLNGDGRYDLILKYNPSQTVYLCEMNETATSWNVSYYSQGFYEKYDLLGVGDLNGDGRDDLILKYKPSNTVYICLMNEPGADKIWTVAYYSQGWAEKYSVLGVGDLNDDARDDLILRYNKSGTVYFCHMRESGATWDIAATEAWGDALSLLALADLNGDFRKDLLVSDSQGLATAWITGENGSTWTKTPVGDWSAYDILFTGDLNADYRDDLIRQTRKTKQVEFLLTDFDDPTSWTASFSADWTNYELLNGLMP